MYYEKQIRYIDYLENGEKKRNCGNVKVTVTGNRLLLEMRIRDLYETDDMASEVVLEGGGTESRVGTVLIRQGSGSFCWECVDREQEGTGIALGESMRYGQLERIYVQLSPRRSMRCIWKASEPTWKNDPPNREVHVAERAEITNMGTRPERQREGMAEETMSLEPQLQPTRQREGMAEETMSPEPRIQPTRQQESMAEETMLREEQIQPTQQTGNAAGGVKSPEPQIQPTQQTRNAAGGVKSPEPQIQPTQQTESTAEKAERPQTHPEGQQESRPESVMQHEREERPVRQSDSINTAGNGTAVKPSRSQRKRQTPHMESMSEDKWQQLQKIYPHIRPFQDKREYLSLRPEDFVILHSSAYRLVQNSFLLHGYFNYDHLILACMQQRGEDQFYIGVPGNFFEKEKQVAIMYGFESFECRQEPAGEGEFGYYMIRVQL